MASISFKRDVVCKPLSALLAHMDTATSGSRFDILNSPVASTRAQMRAASAAVIGDEPKRLAEHAISSHYLTARSLLQRASLMLTKFDAESIKKVLYLNERLRPLIPDAIEFVNDFKLRVLRMENVLNDASVTVRRLASAGFGRNGTNSKLAYLGFSTGNAERILAAAKEPDFARRIAQFRDALMDDTRAANFEDFTWNGKPTNREQITELKKSWLKGVSPIQLDDMLTLYSMAGTLRNDYKDWFIRDFTQRSNRAPTEEEIMEEIGGTVAAYMPRMWRDVSRSGFYDDLVASSAQGIYDDQLHTFSVQGQHMALPEFLRQLASISKDKPMVMDPQLKFEKLEDALAHFFPNLTEVQRREAPQFIRTAVSSADDAMILRATPGYIHDPFFQQRQGVLGFEQDFVSSIMAYISAGARMRELSPAFSAGGRSYEFLRTLNVEDPALARALTGHLDQIIGRNRVMDRELVGVMHPVVRTIAQALFLWNPSPAGMNMTSLILQGVPYAMSDGFIAGSRDTMTAMGLLRNPQWRALYDESRIGGAFAYGFSTTGRDFAKLHSRLEHARLVGDTAEAFRIYKEYGISGGEFLAWSESSMIRPFAAALGTARYYRRHNLHGLTELTKPQIEGIWREMVNIVDQTTTLQGGVNSPPWLNYVRTAPGIGPMASMLTTTPANLASQFFRDLNRFANPGSRIDRWPAFRRLTTQAAMGTMLAGPFWLIPMWRDAETDGDKARLQAFGEEWERYGSLAGGLNTELARRLNPIAGFTERFAPADNQLASLLLGPMGRPVGDIFAAIGGDVSAARRATGIASRPLTGLPPDTVLPSTLQYLVPAGVAAEKFIRMVLSATLEPNQTGSVPIGMGLELPVNTPEGFRLDSQGRPFVSSGRVSSKGRSLFLGGRALDEAQIASEGVRGQKRAERRITVESTVKRHVLDGDMEAAARLLIDNPELAIDITPSELQREALSRKLLPQARAILQVPVAEAVPRVLEAARRLQDGSLRGPAAANEWHILAAGLIRFNQPD